jgi:small subunit ribosomal protein S5
MNLQKKTLKSLSLKMEFEKNEKWSDCVVQIRRVTKVCKGGKKLSFRVVMGVGNKMGYVGVGVGKAGDLPNAISKGIADAKQHLIFVKLTKHSTITHLTFGNFGSAKVLIKPAFEGTGVIAGSAIRIILELVGIKNILAKQLGSKNSLNNARATICALENIKTPNDVAQNRNLSLDKFY